MTMADASLGRQALDLIYEAVRCKERIEYEQHCIKELRDICRKDLALDPKEFDALVQWYSEGGYQIT